MRTITMILAAVAFLAGTPNLQAQAMSENATVLAGAGCCTGGPCCVPGATCCN